MDNWSLRSKLILLSILPTLIVVICFSWIILSSFNKEQENLFLSTAEGESELLASLLAPAVESANHEETQYIIELAIGKNLLSAAQVQDNEGNIIGNVGQFKTVPNLKINNLLQGSGVLTLATDIHKNIKFGDTTNKHEIIATLLTQYDGSTNFSSRFKLILIASLSTLTALIIIGYFASNVGKITLSAINDFKNILQAMTNGKFQSRLEKNYGGEIQNLADTINQLGLTITRNQEQQNAKMEETTNDLQETLETIEVQNIELNLARKEALQASKSKSDFLANTSHEIRTPLGGIIGFSKLLEKTSLDSQQRDYIDIIKQSAENLHAIINDILDFSRIEAGKLSLDNNEFELRPTLEHCINIISPLLTGKRVELALIIQDDTPKFFCADALRLQQVVINLLANAAKFTDEGLITVTASIINKDKESQLKIAVSDTGIGLDQNEQDDLFNAFAQADNSTSRKYGGSGLGLSISKHLVQLMGGEIDFNSKLNKGSIFFFTIKPLSFENKTPSSILQENHILVVEDNLEIQTTIQQQLEYHSASVEVINSKNLEGFDQYNNFNLIIVGLQHDLLNDGLAVQFLSALHQKSQRPVLALQPYSDIHHERIIINNPEILITRKPISTEKIAKRVLQILGEHIEFEPRSKKTAERKAISALVVDDNYANLKLVEIILNEFGIDVSVASTGQQAIDVANKKHFNVVFMDIQMPEVNGYQAVDAIRSSSKLNKETPIIALTAHALNDEKRKILNSGFNAHLTKPVRDKEIAEILTKFFPDFSFVIESNQQLQNSNYDSLNTPVNIGECLRLNNNKADIARFMLKELINSLDSSMTELNTFMENKDFTALLEATHKLHGASCYTGTIPLKQSAMELEVNLKEENYDDTEPLFQNLIAQIMALKDWAENFDLDVLFEE